MRAVKIAGIVVASLLALVVIGAGALLLIVDPNDYRDDIAKLVQEKTGRPMQIGGPLELRIFPWLAIDVHDVTLGNPPGYGDEPFLSVKKASVGVKLLPLLHKEFEVRRVGVDGLAVTLISRGEDENNWKDLGESGEPETPSTGPAPKARIAGVDVTAAVLVYRDEAKNSLTRLSSLDVSTGALGGSEPVEAQMKFDYDDGAGQIVAHIEAKARVSTPAEGSRLEVKDLDLKGDWYGSPDEETKAGATAAAVRTDVLPTRPATEPVTFSASTPSLVVDLDAETLAPTTLDVKLGALPVKLTAQGEKLFGEYVVSGNVAIDRASPRELMKSFDIEAPVTSDPKALSVFALKGDYRLTPKQLQLAALDLTLDDTAVRGSAGIEDLDAMALRFDLDVNAINLDRYMEPKPEAASGGSAPASAAAKPPTDLPIDLLRELNAQGQLRIGRATVTGLEFSDIRLPLAAKDGRTRLGPTQAKLFGGTYDGDIVLDAKPAQARLSLDEHVRGIDIGALMKAGFDTTRLAGRGNASARLNATGNSDAALFKTLAGTIEFDVKEGAVTGLDLWYELRRALALVKAQGLPERPAGAPRTAFNQLSGSAVVDKGVIRNDDLNVDMTYLRAKGKGTLALESQAVDYRIVAEVYKLPAEGAGSELADLKAAEIPITITGTLEDMKVRPDVEGYLKSRFKKEVDQKVDEKKEELKKKLGDKLKGILGGK